MALEDYLFGGLEEEGKKSFFVLTKRGGMF
jgi:hypothetical protein